MLDGSLLKPVESGALVRSLRAAIALAGMVVGFLWASPAEAVPNLSLSSASTVSDSSSSKTVTVNCPAGLSVFGTGAAVVLDSGSSGSVLVHQLFPNSTLTSVTALAAEVPAGFAGNWHLTVQAICGTAVASMQRVKVSVANSTATTKEIDPIECPAGTVIYGSGFAIQGATGQIFIERVQDLFPVISRAESNARKDNSVSPNPSWGLDAMLICGAQASGYEIVGASSAQDSVSPKSAAPACPAGKKIHGSLWSINFQAGDVLLEDIQYTGGITNVTVKAAENNAISANWSVGGRAVCAN